MNTSSLELVVKQGHEIHYVLASESSYLSQTQQVIHRETRSRKYY